jgi:hypothetical protein
VFFFSVTTVGHFYFCAQLLSILCQDMRPRLEEIHVEQNTPGWRAARREFSASESASKTGMSRWSNIISEYYWRMQHQGEDKPSDDGGRVMRAGHLDEPCIARMAFDVLFPRPELVVRGDSPEETKRLSHERNAMRTCGIFPLPEQPKLVSASPDRIFDGHPDRSIHVGLEIKRKDKGLPNRPDPDHLCQNHTQMACLKADYIFLAYGYKRRSVVVFLVQFEPDFWKWIYTRFLRFYDAIQRGTAPTPEEIPSIGAAVYEFWTTGVRPNWARKQYGEAIFRGADTWPKQPRWMLVGYHIHPGDFPGGGADWVKELQTDCLRGGPTQEVRQRALGTLQSALPKGLYMREKAGQSAFGPIDAREYAQILQNVTSSPRLLCYDEELLMVVMHERVCVDDEGEAWYVPEHLFGMHARYWLHLEGYDARLGEGRMGCYTDPHSGEPIVKTCVPTETLRALPLSEAPNQFAQWFQKWFAGMFPKTLCYLTRVVGTVREDSNNVVCSVFSSLFATLSIVESNEEARSWYNLLPLEQ